MTQFPKIQPSTLKEWFPERQQKRYVDRQAAQVGFTRRRAECFILLCAYLMLKQMEERGKLENQEPPIAYLKPPKGWVQCSYREASELFYLDGEQGSERAAGMMIDKLINLNYVEKRFDGNTLDLSIIVYPQPINDEDSDEEFSFYINEFNQRIDAVAVATLLAKNYKWMTKTVDELETRIIRLLKTWSRIYATGMRVLRRSDTNLPVGFYLFFPVQPKSEKIFFGSANNGLHLSSISDEDPFAMALPGDEDCESVFVRSWVIDGRYRDESQQLLLRDAQKTFQKMMRDFPNLCDIYTLIIHPSYEPLIRYLGFQKTGIDTQIYWVHLPIDTFLEMDIPDKLPWSI